VLVDYKFCSAGREDTDVRMLGTGRPFYFELINPKCSSHWFLSDDLKKLESETNSQIRLQCDTQDLPKVAVENLFVLMNPKEELHIIKSAAETKKKTYRCVLCIKSSAQEKLSTALLDSFNGKYRANCPVTIDQKTPIRVMHRRSLEIRKRAIHWMKLEPVSTTWKLPSGAQDCFYYLDLQTQAGAYIKEFAHGDLGRTRPNLGDILAECDRPLGLKYLVDLVQLDVTDVDLIWPPINGS
jgi:tRNA pseudouridine synthase 10